VSGREVPRALQVPELQNQFALRREEYSCERSMSKTRTYLSLFPAKYFGSTAEVDYSASYIGYSDPAVRDIQL
jgi:hypothetical protein